MDHITSNCVSDCVFKWSLKFKTETSAARKPECQDGQNISSCCASFPFQQFKKKWEAVFKTESCTGLIHWVKEIGFTFIQFIFQLGSSSSNKLTLEVLNQSLQIQTSQLLIWTFSGFRLYSDWLIQKWETDCQPLGCGQEH